MSKPLTVALVTTARSDQPSSMSVYAEMIQQVIANHSADIRFTQVNLQEKIPTWRWLPSRLSNRLQLLWLMVNTSAQLSRVPADVYHLVDGSFAHILQGFQRRKVVVTVHDLIPVLQTEGRFRVASPGRIARWLINRNIKVLNQQQYFCTDSDCTKNDLTHYVGKAKNITTIPLTLRKSILEHLPRIIKPWSDRVTGDRTRTILHIGNNGFYKNRKAVLEAFSRLTPHHPLHLVMAGAPPDDALMQQLTELNINCEQVQFIPYPDDAVLANLYEKASILLFPSYYEGFGWPPLEAMAFGCPVVCSNAGSLPEVVGIAALMTSPQDYDGLANHCRSLLDNSIRTEQLIELGYQNLQRFAEAQMADSLVTLYQQVANQQVTSISV